MSIRAHGETSEYLTFSSKFMVMQGVGLPAAPWSQGLTIVCTFSNKLFTWWSTSGQCTWTSLSSQRHLLGFPKVGCCSVAQLCLTLCDPMNCGTPGFPVPSLSPGVCSNSCPSSQWHHRNISSSVIPFSCLQSFPGPGSFPMSWLFPSGGQSNGASASPTVLPKDIQGWFPLGLTGLTSLLAKGRSRVFSRTTVCKHQFFSSQLSLWSNSHIHALLLEKP